jgi:hypothetical protein
MLNNLLQSALTTQNFKDFLCALCASAVKAFVPNVIPLTQDAQETAPAQIINVIKHAKPCLPLTHSGKRYITKLTAHSAATA